MRGFFAQRSRFVLLGILLLCASSATARAQVTEEQFLQELSVSMVLLQRSQRDGARPLSDFERGNIYFGIRGSLKSGSILLQENALAVIDYIVAHSIEVVLDKALPAILDELAAASLRSKRFAHRERVLKTRSALARAQANGYRLADMAGIYVIGAAEEVRALTSHVIERGVPFMIDTYLAALVRFNNFEFGAVGVELLGLADAIEALALESDDFMAPGVSDTLAEVREATWKRLLSDSQGVPCHELTARRATVGSGGH
jgi:hypothetical protein